MPIVIVNKNNTVNILNVNKDKFSKNYLVVYDNGIMFHKVEFNKEYNKVFEEHFKKRNSRIKN